MVFDYWAWLAFYTKYFYFLSYLDDDPGTYIYYTILVPNADGVLLLSNVSFLPPPMFPVICVFVCGRRE